MSSSNFVVEKKGDIKSEYNLLLPELGKGSYGKVQKAVHKVSNLKRAVKIIEKRRTTSDYQNRLINEVNILKGCDHPNIIKILEFFQDDSNFYIVTELCEGGELYKRINLKKRFSEEEAAWTIRQVVSALYYIHSHKIVHRDLKPENILYDSRQDDSLIKVIDFGTSHNYDPNSKMTQKFGTCYYIAPEVLKGQYDESCDVWSCGVILYLLLGGYPPFFGSSDEVVLRKVEKGVVEFDAENWDDVSGNFITHIERYFSKGRV